ncbi:MAG TPA: LuxR C-terminal-related transcriptional regulator [Chitinophagaceae bacterium]|nr:LuxR C-terminal-related transcriptional regulator [Chitinophagaceae bacterium]
MIPTAWFSTPSRQARGYVQKSAGRQDVLDAVRAVHGGHYYYCRTTSTRLAAIIARSGYHRGQQRPAAVFSEREKQIIGLICEEKNNEEIGRALFTSPRSVERLRAGIMEKTGARTPAGVVIYALRNNLYFLE